MGAVASFAKKVWGGIKNIAKKVWNGIKTAAKAVAKVVKKVAVIIVNGIKKTIQVVASIAIQAIKVVLTTFALILFSPLFLLLGVIFLTGWIIFGRNRNNNDNNNNNGDEENNDDNDENNQENKYNLNNNDKPNFENEPKKKETNLMKVFLEDVRSFIKEAGKCPDVKQSFTYTFELKDDKIIAEKKDNQNSETSDEPKQNILCSNIDYEYNDENKYLKLSFENDINDTELGKEILKKIKSCLDSLYNNAVRFTEIIEESEFQEIEIDSISNIETVSMIINS